MWISTPARATFSWHLINVSVRASLWALLLDFIRHTGPTAQCAGKNLLVSSQVSLALCSLALVVPYILRSQSSTSAKTANTFQISFGDGSAVRANVLTDVVSIGGLAITNSGVGAVTQLSQSFTNAGGDTSDGFVF